VSFLREISCFAVHFIYKPEGLQGYLSNPYYKLQECARMVACKIKLDEDEFVEKINPGLMEAVFAWCKLLMCKIELDEDEFVEKINPGL